MANKNKIIMNKEEMNKAIKRLADEIVKENSGVEDIAIIGIQTRGVPIGKRIITEILKSEPAKGLKEIPFGILDITLYRDDMDSMASVPVVKDTVIPFDINGKVVVIVDDVIFTGRSVRAAIDELIDFGRPKRIELAVLIDRGHRELPIEPNFVGKKIPTKREEIVAVEVDEVDGKDNVILRQKEK
ncbi:MAG: bifunctional pyr operon transcriptional regulator/uracil phosphoribosyltransferase PyrR [Elusimicrobia bacterium]|nr:bifunctional pyr operon transcriptional regulator/uracil phosphoribosyltransferase PyrR [Candidatus Liberimonas magnetica]